MTAFDVGESRAIKPSALVEILSPIYDDSLIPADLLEPSKDVTNTLVFSGVLPELGLIIPEAGIGKDQVKDPMKDLQVQPEKLETLTQKTALELERGKLASNLKDAGISGVSIEKLEADLKSRHISNDTTSDIYRSLNKILEVEPQLLNKDLRTLLVKDFLQELSNPYSINQGIYNTCQLSGLERRLVARQPEVVAKMLEQVALNGTYQPRDGQLIKIPQDLLTVDPPGEASADRVRSYSSKIFQITTANAFWRQQELCPDGKPQLPGEIRYSQNPKRSAENPSGEEIYCKDRLAEKGSPYLYGFEILIAESYLTGKFDNSWMVFKPDSIEVLLAKKNDIEVPEVKSPIELRNFLAAQKDAMNYPIYVTVRAARLTQYMSENGLTNSGEEYTALNNNHVVMITDYDKSSGKVKISNTWGPSNNLTDSDSLPTAEELFVMMTRKDDL